MGTFIAPWILAWARVLSARPGEAKRKFVLYRSLARSGALIMAYYRGLQKMWRQILHSDAMDLNSTSRTWLWEQQHFFGQEVLFVAFLLLLAHFSRIWLQSPGHQNSVLPTYLILPPLFLFFEAWMKIRRYRNLGSSFVETFVLSCCACQLPKCNQHDVFKTVLRGRSIPSWEGKWNVITEDSWTKAEHNAIFSFTFWIIIS